MIERQLAHRERNKARPSYNQAEYLGKRRAMMQQWADMVDSTAPQNKLGRSSISPRANVGQDAVDVDLEDYH